MRMTLLLSSLAFAGGPGPATDPGQSLEERPFSVDPNSITLWELEDGIEISLFTDDEGAVTLFNDTDLEQEFTLSITSLNTEGLFTFDTSENNNVYEASGKNDGERNTQTITVRLGPWGFSTYEIDFRPPTVTTSETWGMIEETSSSLFITSQTYGISGDIRVRAYYEIPYEESTP